MYSMHLVELQEGAKVTKVGEMAAAENDNKLDGNASSTLCHLDAHANKIHDSSVCVLHG